MQNPQFFIDTPSGWQTTTRLMLIRGWFVDGTGEPAQRIRLTVGELAFFATVGLPRPDVNTALGLQPEILPGFDLRAVLPLGRQKLVLEAQAASGRWIKLRESNSHISRPTWPRWLCGASAAELLAFQMPLHMTHPPRPVRLERFPDLKTAGRPRLSIVTPSFQQGVFLEETIRSVTEERDADCEYVVCDGGSTDESVAIIRRYEKSLARWTSERDRGQADAIARGFRWTQGAPDDVMAWINSDDYYLPRALAFVADYFARHPTVDVIYGHRILVNERSEEIARWFLPRHDEEILRLNDFVPQETMFWRRRVWDRVGGIDPRFRFAMDWDLLLRFQAAGAKIVRVPYFLACFRLHANQKTSAVMQSIGLQEITRLRTQANGRHISDAEIAVHPRLVAYLKRSAFIQSLWRCGIRAP